MLFIINVLISSIGFVYYTKKTIDKRMILSPHMIIWGMPILLLFYPALLNRPFYVNNFSFNLIMTFGLLGSVVGCLITRIPRLEISSDHTWESKDRINIPDILIKVGAIIYLLYLLYHIIKPVLISGSFIGALSVNRLDRYLSEGILEGSGVELLFLFPEILYFIYIGYSLNKKHYHRAIILGIILSLYYVLNANTRLPMIMPLASLIIIGAARLTRRLLLWLMPLMLILGIIFVFTFSILGNAIRWGRLATGDDIIEAIRDFFENQGRLELGYYDWLYHLYDAIDLGQVSPDGAAAWCYYGPISIFPRVLWPSKPITSTSNRLTESVYNTRIGTGIPITTFTIYGEGYWQLGYFGAFLAPILFMVIYGILIKNIQSFRDTDFWVAMQMCQMATFFRGELPIPQFITTLIFIILLWLLWWKWETFVKLPSLLRKRFYKG